MKNTTAAENLNTPLPAIVRTTKQNIKKNLEEMNNTDLIDMYRKLHSVTAELTFLHAHGIFSKVEHFLCHKTNLNQFKRIEIIHRP